MQFWLNPIVGYPASFKPHNALKTARRAGYSKIVMAPLNGWNEKELRQVPPDLVGSIEDVWHPLTDKNLFQREAWLRTIGKRSEAQAAFPWDNLFWGDAKEAQERMLLIRQLFSHAIYSGHAPQNTVGWSGPYAWEINPDHEIQSATQVLTTPGKLSIDFVHLMRPARAIPHNSLVHKSVLVPFLRELIQKRAQDISIVHLHLKATEIVPFALGLVPQYLKDAFKVIATVDKGDLPVAVQFLPFVPMNLHWTTAAIFLKRIRLVTEQLATAAGVVYSVLSQATN